MMCDELKTIVSNPAFIIPNSALLYSGQMALRASLRLRLT